MLEAGFYTHKGRRAWKAGHRLKSLGIPCADLIALVERRKYGLLSTSYLIMKEVPDAVQVDTLLIRNYFRINGRLSKEEIAEKTRLIRAAAHAVREVHAKKIYHKDLSAKNLLASIDAGGRLCLCFVDVDSIQFPIRLSMRRRIKNLAQLNGVPGCVTATDKLRFYKEYFGLQTLTPAHKFLIRVIHRLSRRRRADARRIDAYVRRNFPLDERAYEDITSV